jgi:hypothetical protein
MAGYDKDYELKIETLKDRLKDAEDALREYANVENWAVVDDLSYRTNWTHDDTDKALNGMDLACTYFEKYKEKK